MANPRLSLTDAICKRAKPQATEYALHDSRQPGLSLRVQPSGARSWIMRARLNGRQAKHSLGTFPKTGVKAARQVANALLAGNASAPKLLSDAPLFEVFQAEHEAKHGRSFKPSGLRAYRSYVHTQLLPAFAGKALDAITRPDVVRWFESYSLVSPGGANRALGILGQMIDCAKRWGHLSSDWINPVSGVRHNRRKIVGTFLTEMQLERLGEVLALRMADGCIAASLLRFLTLTGCRVSEAIDLEWGDVLNDRLRLRDSKTGPRDVPLGTPVRQFLKALRSNANQSLRAKTPLPARKSHAVFPLPSRRGYGHVRSVWHSVRRQADLPSSLRIHDLCHSFASHAVMSGETLLTTSRLLGHRRIQTTARYAHLADGTLLDAAEKIGGLLMMQAAGRRTGKAVNIAV
ncbi:site-specific integrase [Sphingobium sp. AN558]|uniref:tyrosine-type recombinase/integrase n=1 Tax=Sphingobium sp. AN558 TaxID=3133442 RepID=UPI0030C40143